MPTLGLIHTVASLVPVFAELAAERLPRVATFNIVDESLLHVTIREGRLTPATTRRLAGYVAGAAEAGADAVLVTCSSVGPAAEAARALVDIPVIRVDEPMAEAAVDAGERIGVLATLATTLQPTRALVERVAAARDRRVTVEARLVVGAFERLGAGDRAGHDELVGASLDELMDRADVVVLAQASMARVLAARGAPSRVPVLASPPFGIDRAGELLAAS